MVAYRRVVLGLGASVLAACAGILGLSDPLPPLPDAAASDAAIDAAADAEGGPDAGSPCDLLARAVGIRTILVCDPFDNQQPGYDRRLYRDDLVATDESAFSATAGGLTIDLRGASEGAALRLRRPLDDAGNEDRIYATAFQVRDPEPTDAAIVTVPIRMIINGGSSVDGGAELTGALEWLPESARWAASATANVQTPVNMTSQWTSASNETLHAAIEVTRGPTGVRASVTTADGVRTLVAENSFSRTGPTSIDVYIGNQRGARATPVHTRVVLRAFVIGTR
jgi:hypothetical protein